MIIQSMSDLHEEYNPGRVASLTPAEDADVLVLAGDIFAGLNPAYIFELFKSKWKDKEIVYVPGNHEYYHYDAAERLESLHAMAEQSGVHMLRTGRVLELHGRRFLGDTMWFPNPPTSGHQRKGSMPDFRLIKNFEPWVYEQNKAFTAFLHKELREGDIVVTHHLPHEGAGDPYYYGAPSNVFFISDQRDLILERKPALWFYGHTHHAKDFKCGDTRLVCNPGGYPREWDTLENFNPLKTVELA